MKASKPKDERIERTLGIIYRRGFLLLVIGVAADLLVKTAYWRPGDMDTPFFLAIGLEALILIAALLYCLAAASRQGIILALEDQETPVFPKKLYLRVSLCLAGFICGSFLLRMVFYPSWEYGLAAFLLVIGGLTLLFFLLSFAVCAVAFRLAFHFVLRARQRLTEEPS